MDNNRQNRNLEKQYLPRADANAKREQQAGLYGGLAGGSAEAQGQHGYEQILQLLLAQKQKVRQQQSAQEMQGMSALAALIGGSLGGPAGGVAAGEGMNQVGHYYDSYGNDYGGGK